MLRIYKYSWSILERFNNENFRSVYRFCLIGSMEVGLMPNKQFILCIFYST